jgi:hypothetical protein
VVHVQHTSLPISLHSDYLVSHHGWQVSPFLQTTTALRERRGIALLCFYISALEGGEGSASRPGRFTPGKDPVTIVQEAGWVPGPVWTCAENLALTGIRSPDRPSLSQSLYRLSYRAREQAWRALKYRGKASWFSELHEDNA